MTEIKNVFTTPDGKQFDTKAEAVNHLRLPKIREAFAKLTDNNTELAEWLIANQEQVEMAFETGTIRRVSKAEKKKLQASLDAIKEAGNPKFAFVVDNLEAIYTSFRWPSVTRLKPEEKTAAAQEALMKLSDDNAELVGYVLANQEGIMACYEAGIEKRPMNPKAAEALVEWRAKEAAKKAAKATEEVAG